MPDLVGQALKGRYRIDELIGRGGMAEVYKAWDSQRQYHVAVKVMREDLAEDPEFLDRFHREAQALAALSHAHIIRFYSFERDGRLAFLVMDYVQGTTLRGLLLDAEGRPLPLGQVAWVLEQACAAVHYAHTQNVLHRDLKPGNLMIRPDGQVLVADFGIAKAADAATATTVMPGTPAYMSPEQCRSEPLDARADVYSLGIVAYEMLAGRRPFSGDRAQTGTGSTRERIRWEQVHADPPPLRPYNPAVTPELEAAVLKALAKERAERWPTPLAFWQALQRAFAAAGVKAEAVGAASPVIEPAAIPTSSAPRQPALPAGQRGGVRLPAWAWVLGGLLLAGLLILMLAGAGGLLGRETPSPTAVVQVTTETPTLTGAPPAPGSTDTGTPEPTDTGSPPPGTTDTDTPTPASEPTDTDTPAPTPTIFPTDTDTPTPVPRPTDTDTPTPVPPPPVPKPSARFGRLAFTSTRDGNPEIYVADLSSGRVSRVTDNNADDWLPDWSLDGRSIGFTSNRRGNYDLWSMDADGRNPQSLVAEAAWDDYARWNPDGKRLAFSSTGMSGGQANAEIFVRRADGSLKQVTESAPEDQYPDWSPDGGRIVYGEGTQRAGNWDLYIINANGSSPRLWLGGAGCDVQPAWSPDGRRIAFLRTRDTNGNGTPDEKDAGDIWVGEVDGGSPWRLTSGRRARTPAWSPDGQWIAFAEDAGETGSIMAVHLESGTVELLVQSRGRDNDPSWTW